MYDNVISLGHYCGVASSMIKYGLRSWSGPFDWYFSNFEGVLRTIENNFSDFFNFENLQVSATDKTKFKDTKYGFFMVHDVKKDFYREFPEIKEKYLKRSERFRVEAARKTCFIRAIRSVAEIEFIQKNTDYIDQVIKSSNPENTIMYIYLNQWRMDIYHLIDEKMRKKWFFWGIDLKDYSGSSKNELMALFDSNPELLFYCRNILSESQRKDNIIYELNSELRDLRIIKWRYELLNKILDLNIETADFPEEVIIYGVGNIGKRFYERIKSQCKVLCFIDQYQLDNTFDSIPIYELSEFDYTLHSAPIIVTPMYEYEEIKVNIKNAVKDRNIDVWPIDICL